MITYSRKRSRAATDHEFDDDLDTGLPTPPRSSSPLSEQTPEVINRRPAATKKRKLTQMTIDLGGNPQKSCKVCGMDYMSTNPEDVSLHARYHGKVVNGLQAPSSLLKLGKILKTCATKSSDKASKELSGQTDYIVQVRRSSDSMAKTFVRAALNVVEKELGAVSIPDKVLWAQLSEDRSLSEGGQRHDRHQAYLYLHQGNCVGFCLTERIKEARKVIPQSGSLPSSSISTSEDIQKACLGISRIWTSKDHRNLSIATELLKAAQKSFEHGRRLLRDEMAFSQPTSNGAGLARKWFGKTHGWLVYDC